MRFRDIIYVIQCIFMTAFLLFCAIGPIVALCWALSGIDVEIEYVGF